MLAAGTRFKLFDFLGYFFFYFNGVLPGNEMIFFSFVTFFCEKK